MKYMTKEEMEYIDEQKSCNNCKNIIHNNPDKDDTTDDDYHPLMFKCKILTERVGIYYPGICDYYNIDLQNKLSPSDANYKIMNNGCHNCGHYIEWDDDVYIETACELASFNIHSQAICKYWVDVDEYDEDEDDRYDEDEL